MGKVHKNGRNFQKETQQKNFRYNRFLLLRYLLALFFFVNLHVMILFLIGHHKMAIWPMGLLIAIVPAVFEHVKLYGAKEDEKANQLRYTALYYHIQLMVNLLLSLSALTGVGFHTIFPFLTNTMQSRFLVLAILAIGLLLIAVCLKRITAIRSQKDRHYQYIQKYEKAINK
ncbi:hypothetical protein IV487_12560 [Enterococcus saccharolyticus]|uniref:hypothetical protein n=1 Tax=Enterococcus TaxID=1350 RepID=UPI001E2DC792|nr:hypothetical protein [Enterococcus saccharolyticus]MCD5003296.1 hypothetical protein [Enterococcus saccharolyticus]